MVIKYIFSDENYDNGRDVPTSKYRVTLSVEKQFHATGKKKRKSSSTLHKGTRTGAHTGTHTGTAEPIFQVENGDCTLYSMPHKYGAVLTKTNENNYIFIESSQSINEHGSGRGLHVQRTRNNNDDDDDEEATTLLYVMHQETLASRKGH